MKTSKMKVLLFSCEDGKRVLQQRVTRICQQVSGIDQNELQRNLFILDASDLDPALYREQRIGRGVPAIETPLLNKLATFVQERDIGLIIIDNASDAFDGDEIKRTQVRGFIRSLRSRLARPGRAVLLLAHVNKVTASYGRNAGSEAYSGSTAWHNSVRSRLSLSQEGQTGMVVLHEKANLGPKADPLRLEWVAGMPKVVVSAAADSGGSRDLADKEALVKLIRDFDSRGERVTTSCQGSSTTFRLLKNQSGFPPDTDAGRVMRLLRELENDGRIFRRVVTTPDRKKREIFTCACQPDGCAHSSEEEP
ncbi:MAG: AAA family ATPase [Magnetococcales bacterium]|nr:AAA family ATPase [Magnetococcales bacterium]